MFLTKPHLVHCSAAQCYGSLPKKPGDGPQISCCTCNNLIVEVSPVRHSRLVTGGHEIHCHYCPCHFVSLCLAVEFSSLHCLSFLQESEIMAEVGAGARLWTAFTPRDPHIKLFFFYPCNRLDLTVSSPFRQMIKFICVMEMLKSTSLTLLRQNVW